MSINALSAVYNSPWIVLHSKPEVSYRGTLPVPMTFTVFVKWCKHYRQYRLYIVAHQTAEILIIPQI